MAAATGLEHHQAWLELLDVELLQVAAHARHRSPIGGTQPGMKEGGVANAVHVKIGIRREPDDQDADRRVRDRLSHSLLEGGRVHYRPFDEEDSAAARCEVGRDLVKDTQRQLVAARRRKDRWPASYLRHAGRTEAARRSGQTTPLEPVRIDHPAR